MSLSRRELSKFELIPNEILMDIFEYLSPHDVFQAFYYLNQRYDYFLLSLQFRIDLINVTKKMFDYHNYLLFPFAAHRVISLRCEDLFDRLIYQINLSHFLTLKYLTITQLRLVNLVTIMSKLNGLPELIYLNLQAREDENNREKIIFHGHLPALNKCVLNINQPIAFDGQHGYPNLQDLTINGCTIGDLFSMFPYTPQLLNLTVTLNDGNIPDDVLPNCQLQSLAIHTTSVLFNRLVQTLFPFLPQVQRLSIEAVDLDYADGREWSTVLSTHFPRLNTFDLHVNFPQHDLPTADARLELLNRFDMKYFVIHRWSFAMIHCPSSGLFTLFSIPMMNKDLALNLYQTEIITKMTNVNFFENIKHVFLYLTHSDTVTNPVRSPNAETLRLISQYHENQVYPKQLLVDISRVVNLSKLKSIEFVGTHFPTSCLVLLEYTPNLHSLDITFHNLIKMTKRLTDPTICRRLATLIKHLTIRSIDKCKDFVIFERLPNVFPQLQSLSLTLENPEDLYIIMILILSKMSIIIKSLIISIENRVKHEFLDQFMVWLIDYLHNRDLDLVDVKLDDQQVYFSF